MTAIPIYPLISIKLPQWAIAAIEKSCLGFFWAGEQTASGGQCMLAWKAVARPQELGGLGITDLQFVGFALRLCWLWFKRTDTRRPWSALPLDCEPQVQAMFDASTQVQLADGNKALFWTDKWLNGTSIQLCAPDLYHSCQQESATNKDSEALQGNRWIRDITAPMTIMALAQYLELWPNLQAIELLDGVADRITWRWTSTGQYTAKSAYRMFFAGSTKLAGENILWKTWAPQKVKLFVYIALHQRTWTAERRKRHGLQDEDSCCLCDQAQETIDHLIFNCPIAKEVWWAILNWVHLPRRFQQANTSHFTSWSNIRGGLPKA